jgi:uncharacterized protein (DUF2141 family)
VSAAIAAFAGLTLIAAPATGGSIEVAVSGVRSAQGRVHVDICRRADFLKDCPYSGEAPARAGVTTILIRDVPPGCYAAQGFHDRNANGKVDRGLFGIPKEDIGFSNDAPVRAAPPRFEAAAFDHGPADQRIGFTLRHFLD